MSIFSGEGRVSDYKTLAKFPKKPHQGKRGDYFRVVYIIFKAFVSFTIL